jgi:hypothetical protein
MEHSFPITFPFTMPREYQVKKYVVSTGKILLATPVTQPVGLTSGLQQLWKGRSESRRHGESLEMDKL